MSDADIIKTTAIPFTARVDIGGQSYPLAKFDVTFLSNTLSVATADFSVGLRADGKTGVTQFEFPRGTPATVWMDVEETVKDPAENTTLVPAGSHKIFDGVVNDTGPSNLSKGAFNLQIALVSNAAKLNTGTLQLSKLVPNSFLDTTVPIGQTDRDPQIANNNPNFIGAELSKDFWVELRRVLNAIATSGAGRSTDPLALNQLAAVLRSTNTTAAEILGTIRGRLTPKGSWASVTFSSNLARYLTALFSGDFRMHSFFTRIVSLGQEFKFRTVESPLGIAVVPYSPFFPSSHAVSIMPSSIIAVEWQDQQPESCGGVVMTQSGPSSIETRGSKNLVIGSHIRPGLDQKPLGIVMPVQSPAWMGQLINRTGQVIGTASAQKDITDGYCKELALEQAYVGRTLQVVCPLRLDIGCLTPVKIQYPTIAGFGGNTAVYGSVQMVKLTADAVSKTAGTVLEVGYVRSTAQQNLEFESYTHPIWTEQYRGASLTQPPA
jgi:hypothetical protein